MKSLRSFVAASVLLVGAPLVAASACAAGDLVLTRDGMSDYVIVVPRSASPATRRGARELVEHIRLISGSELRIIDDDAPAPAHAIMLGAEPPGDKPAADTQPPLGADGFVIRSVGERVYIAGPGPRGTMYACSAFLESLGVRWFTPTVTSAPAKPTITLAPINVREVPAFEYREPFFTEAFDKDWAARLRLNGNTPALDESTGGKVAYAEFVHTFDSLVPQNLFDTHPEYFPLIGGQRTGGYVQRCLSNPDVLPLAIAGVKRAFAARPDAVIMSVSQNDCGAWCQCDACRAITEKYSSHSGLYLWFVNQVAEAIEKDHPDKLIDTLAYQFTEAPPKGIVPRHNVRVRLCPIAVCESHPYERCDFPATREYVANLAAWSSITSTLYIWHYNTDFANYLMPFPDFDEFPADLRLYQRSGVKGVFFQGAYAPGGGGSDAELRSYVMAKILWNPALDTDTLVTEWMQGVYGPAWKPMREWFDLLHQRARKPQNHLRIYDPPSDVFFPPEVRAAGDTLFDQAASLATSDQQRHDIAKARLWLRYVKLVMEPRDDTVLDAFLNDARSFGITSLNEGGTLESWAGWYRSR
ncbi:MAG: DUF4838 domain-containing protein [Phycisphaerae bacterium]|nr:DUF4838 domain-containing protein [Phycisphaerae bacterium]